MASTTREVITLQFGHYANFVGTHLWNIQESSFVYDDQMHQDNLPIKELNNDVMFREGQTLTGEVTYTPRLIAVDLKGSLTHLKETGDLYGEPKGDAAALWNGGLTVHEEEISEKNEFLKDLEEDVSDLNLNGESSQNTDNFQLPATAKLYDLDNVVKSWSDYLRLFMHPKSLYVINKYQHSNELDKFDIFGAGLNLFTPQSGSSDLEDRCHFLLEDCDHLQGFHILVDMYNGFGGVCSSLLQQLEEDCPNRAFATFPVYPAHFENLTSPDDIYKVINSALTLDRLSSLGSFVAPMSLSSTLWRRPGPPLSFPHLDYEAKCNYHSSAVLAAALESLTSPYRTLNSPCDMMQMASCLTPVGRKVLSVHSSMPLPVSESKTLMDLFIETGDELPWSPLSPYSQRGVPLAQSVVLRGISKAKALRPPDQHTPPQLGRCQTADQLLELYLSETCPSSLSAGLVLNNKVKTVAPFPHIFKQDVNPFGNVSSRSRPSSQGVQEMPVATSLQCSQSSSHILTKLLQVCEKIDIRKYHRFMEHGLEQEEFKEVLSNLETLAQNYDERTEGFYS